MLAEFGAMEPRSEGGSRGIQRMVVSKVKAFEPFDFIGSRISIDGQKDLTAQQGPARYFSTLFCLHS